VQLEIVILTAFPEKIVQKYAVISDKLEFSSQYIVAC